MFKHDFSLIERLSQYFGYLCAGNRKSPQSRHFLQLITTESKGLVIPRRNRNPS
jgi:hypothetical protein